MHRRIALATRWVAFRRRTLIVILATGSLFGGLWWARGVEPASAVAATSPQEVSACAAADRLLGARQLDQARDLYVTTLNSPEGYACSRSGLGQVAAAWGEIAGPLPDGTPEKTAATIKAAQVPTPDDPAAPLPAKAAGDPKPRDVIEGLILAGRYDDAKSVLTEALKKDPSFPVEPAWLALPNPPPPHPFRALAVVQLWIGQWLPVVLVGMLVAAFLIFSDVGRLAWRLPRRIRIATPTGVQDDVASRFSQQIDRDMRRLSDDTGLGSVKLTSVWVNEVALPDAIVASLPTSGVISVMVSALRRVQPLWWRDRELRLAVLSDAPNFSSVEVSLWTRRGRQTASAVLTAPSALMPATSRASLDNLALVIALWTWYQLAPRNALVLGGSTWQSQAALSAGGILLDVVDAAPEGSREESFQRAVAMFRLAHTLDDHNRAAVLNAASAGILCTDFELAATREPARVAELSVRRTDLLIELASLDHTQGESADVDDVRHAAGVAAGDDALCLDRIALRASYSCAAAHLNTWARSKMRDSRSLRLAWTESVRFAIAVLEARALDTYAVRFRSRSAPAVAAWLTVTRGLEPVALSLLAACRVQFAGAEAVGNAGVQQDYDRAAVLNSLKQLSCTNGPPATALPNVQWHSIVRYLSSAIDASPSERDKHRLVLDDPVALARVYYNLACMMRAVTALDPSAPGRCVPELGERYLARAKVLSPSLAGYATVDPWLRATS